MSRVIDAVERWLESERDQLFLWLPVALGSGIALWFVLPDLRGWTLAALLLTAAAAAMLTLDRGGRMTRVLASELAGDGITVNMVSPGIIDTVRGAAAGARPEATRTLAGIPLGREGTPEEIAHIVAMLCHPQGGYTTGQVLEINGGMHFS